MSASGKDTDKLPQGQCVPVASEKEKIIFPDEYEDSKEGQIVFEEECPSKLPKPDIGKETPIELINKNTIAVGLKKGFGRDAKGNPTPAWE